MRSPTFRESSRDAGGTPAVRFCGGLVRINPDLFGLSTAAVRLARALEIPQANCVVQAGRDDRVAVGRVGQAEDRLAVTGHLALELARGRVPQFYEPVLAARNEKPTIRRERKTARPALIGEAAQQPPARRIPKLDRAVF